MNRHSDHKDARSAWWLRISWGLTGALWFFWIGIEDRSTFTVLIMSAALVSALAITGYQRRVNHLPDAGKRRLVGTLLLGLLGGMLVPPTAILLMAVKISLHNHAVPDFTREDVISVLTSTPAWVLGGLLFAAANALSDRLQSE